MALATVIPSRKYIKIKGSSGSSKSTYWSSTAGLKVGDIITVKGSSLNDGIYTIINFTSHNYSQYMVVSGPSITDETAFTLNTDSTYSNTDTINIVDSADVRVGQTVFKSGSIDAGQTVATIAAGTEGINASQIRLSASSDGGLVASGQSLLFTSASSAATVTIKARRTTGDKLIAIADAEGVQGVVDVWSYNDISDASSANDGWTDNEIKPVISDNVTTSEFLFSFADEVLRVNDSNAENDAIVRWYGYVQRNQFASASSQSRGLSISGWFDHPAFIYPPSVVAMINSSQHTVATDAHYATLNDLVEDGSGNDALTTEVITAITETDIPFDFASTALNANHLFEIGQVYSILTTSSSKPECFLVRMSGGGLSTGGVSTYRGYGGTTDAQIADNSGAVYKRGIGWNIGVTDDGDDGDWEDKVYEFWQTFIYDGNQESLPTKFTNTYTLSSAKSLECTVYADLYYSGRISGGRIYIRESGSDNPLMLFVDIDIELGCRMTLNAEYTGWTSRTDGSDSHQSGWYCAEDSSNGLKSTGPNLDTYETLNGFSHDVKFNSIGLEMETYNAVKIAGRRSFIANMVTKDKSGAKIRLGDRIMYSEINKFDTYLPYNFIDVSKGDYGEYTALEHYADRLLAFKHNLVHIINISSPSPAGWYLENTIEKQGVSFHYSVTKTEFGVVWANESGLFFYNGSTVRNLAENKLGVFDASNNFVKGWSDFIMGSTQGKNPMVGYDAVSNQVLIMRSPNNLTTESNGCFIYDFDSNSWTFNTNLFTDSNHYTNFATDWNNNLIVGHENASTTEVILKYLAKAQYQADSGDQIVITKDIDFGAPGIMKKIYKIVVTYKSTSAQTTPFRYAIDGTGIFKTLTGNMSATFSASYQSNGSLNLLTAEKDDSASTVTLAVDDGSVFNPGDILKVDNEQLLVQSISSNNLTVVRAQNGSTIETLEDDDQVYILKYDVGTFSPSSIISCQSIQFKLETSASSLMEINDITVQYRVIGGKAVT